MSEYFCIVPEIYFADNINSGQNVKMKPGTKISFSKRLNDTNHDCISPLFIAYTSHHRSKGENLCIRFTCGTTIKHLFLLTVQNLVKLSPCQFLPGLNHVI